MWNHLCIDGTHLIFRHSSPSAKVTQEIGAVVYARQVQRHNVARILVYDNQRNIVSSMGASIDPKDIWVQTRNVYVDT
jgi:hypothetical protein